jgi:hypothetical protein
LASSGRSPAQGTSTATAISTYSGKNSVTGQRAIWLMNGTTWAGERFLPTVGLEWQIAATADFNKDGTPTSCAKQHDRAARDLVDERYNVGGGAVSADGWPRMADCGFRGFHEGRRDDIVWQNSATGSARSG